MKLETISEESIKMLVDRFYLKIRADSALGPVFNDAIGHSDEQWGPHLNRMYDFWSSIMLTSGRYHGNPMQKHKNLPVFEKSLFERWLDLFEKTAHEIHPEHIARHYTEKSRRIAENLKANLYTRGNEEQIR
ncbi:MAG: group III truncated hemoglobin [Alphaproteobacteria bacterium]|nr:group III truncated hemoglobin [Alphaproteobacteria bacterium]